MEEQNARWNIASVGLTLVGAVGALLTFLQLEAYLATGLLLLVTTAGALLLLKKQKAYAVTMLAVGVLGLAFAIVGYLNQGFATLTVLYLLLGVAGGIRGSQAYRATELPS